ncbi:MAG: type II secretion system F family protein [Actinomycetota bacterium]|nr:type II secretion system F family protein [Actinomycetota bacterium]
MSLSVAPAAIPGALCAALAVGCAVMAVARPPRRLGPRVHDYTLVARSKLGSGPGVLSLTRPPASATGALVRVLGPMLDEAARRLGRLLGIYDDELLALELRRAGIRGMSPKRYRKQQLLIGVAGAVGGIALGALCGASLGGSPTPFAVLGGFCGFAAGATWRTGELGRRVKERQERMRGELFSLCQVLAIYARATPNLLSITEAVAERSRGQLAEEMREVLRRIEAGTAAEAAFFEAARLTAEPAAGRLYRTMATAARSGGDIADALLAQSGDIRDAQREEIKQSAIKRRGAMLAPLLLLLAPTMLLFIVAAFPRILLGL